METEVKANKEVRRLGALLQDLDHKLAQKQEQLENMEQKSASDRKNPLMSHMDDELIRMRQENEELRLKVDRAEGLGPVLSEKILRKAELDEMGEEIEQLIRLLK